MKFFIFVCLIASQIGNRHVSSFSISSHIPQPVSRRARVGGRTAEPLSLAFQKVIEKRHPQSRETVTTLRGGATISIPGLCPVNSFLANNPFAAAFAICAIKATAADVVAQSTEDKTTTSTSESSPSEDSSSFNKRRTVAFFFYGGAYQGCFQEFLFNGIYPKIFGHGASILTAIQKATFNMLIVSPFLCLPVAYLIKAVVFGQTFRDGLTKYVHDVKENKLLKKYWMLWTPVSLLTFSIVPEYLRVTFVAFVSFFWLILLSTISARRTESTTPAKA